MENKKQNELREEVERLKKKLAQKNREIKDLKMTNLFLKTLFDGISEEIMVIDQGFVINDVNRAFLARYGLKKSDVLHKKCFEIKERSRAPCNRNGMSCPVERVNKSGGAVEMTHTYSEKGGDTKEFIIIMYPIMTKGDEIKYYLVIARDVTEYRHLISRLQRSEKRFKAILDTATDAIVSVDENNRIILFNNAARRIFGYSSDKVMGRNLKILIPSIYGDHRSHINRFLDKTLSLEGLRSNGEKFPIELSLSILEMEGKITFTAIIRDVMEQQQLKGRMLQSERLAAVGQAVAHVAHEIRNPLMIIGGFSSQIKEKLEDEKDVRKINMVLEEVLRLERLVANLGDFTKGYKLLKRPADINSVIEDVIKIMTGVCSPEKYSFRTLFSKQVQEIYCDPDKLKQVFINIISNGIEAMHGGGWITIITEKIPMGVEIRIEDDGVGIPGEELQHIFEPFYTTREQGSGLGLSISYKLIEAHNGDIWAVSSPGKGATFIIQLPG